MKEKKICGEDFPCEICIVKKWCKVLKRIEKLDSLLSSPSREPGGWRKPPAPKEKPQIGEGWGERKGGEQVCQV